MDIQNIPEPKLQESFQVEVNVDAPVIVGKDDINGLRRLITMSSGRATGKLSGELLPGGVDSQIIRPDGFTELSARYALKLDDGKTVYIENNGIRRVDSAYAADAAMGMIIDPAYVYFASTPRFEVFDESLKWLERSVFVCYGARLPDRVLLKFYQVV